MCPEGSTLDAEPIPPFHPRQSIPVPAPTAPVAGRTPDPADSRAASRADTTSSNSTCIAPAQLNHESSHSPTTGMTTSSATSGTSASAIRQAAS